MKFQNQKSFLDFKYSILFVLFFSINAYSAKDKGVYNPPVDENKQSAVESSNFEIDDDYKTDIAAYLSENDKEKAYYKSLHEDKNNVQRWIDLSIVQSNLNKKEKSINSLKKALFINPKDVRANKLMKQYTYQSSNKYIIQVGAFVSGSNANKLLRTINPFRDHFVISKKLEGNLYKVYFDGFIDLEDADRAMNKLQTLNPRVDFYLKKAF